MKSLMYRIKTLAVERFIEILYFLYFVFRLDRGIFDVVLGFVYIF